ncbi:MAG: methyltransferase domain-containing protein [Alphaproteobacteria bacterium]|nr:methyltransferase domain-containing protein [Alphaproteobacteria bacterium]
MKNNIFVFDRNIVRHNRNRCASKLSNHSFLVDWALGQISERLKDIKRDFSSALQIGCRSHQFNFKEFGIENLYTLDIAENLNPNIQADEELLPFAPNSFDLILSPLNLHTTNDLPGTLAQIKHCLKPDGMFIAALLGGETLYELRESMNSVEMEIHGGLSPHIFPFADMPQMGSLMQRAGFNLPVIDSEKIIVTYDNALKLMEDIRNMGEGNALIERKKYFSSYNFFGRIVQDYAERYSEPDGRIKATFEVIFIAGWAPHESQQKPLRPGSAEKRLADALKSTEEKLSC